MIRNPEVQTLVPTLLAAISNPNAATRTALDVLLSTTFVNTVDTASLALIIPVVQRGLRDRSGDVKKRAARIVGNMCSLINEPKVCSLSSSRSFLPFPTLLVFLSSSLSLSLFSLLSATCAPSSMSPRSASRQRHALSCPSLNHLNSPGPLTRWIF